MGERRAVDIEKLLSWAYRDELPKQQVGSTWGYYVSPFSLIAELGTRVDDYGDEYEPGFPGALGQPHDDAFAIERAVQALEDYRIDWGLTRHAIMGNLAALVRKDDVSLSALVISRSGLMTLHARMGTRPRLEDDPLPHLVAGRNGKPVVQYLDEAGHLIEGRKGRHYGPQARCPLEWIPPPREVAFARIEYQAWYDTLWQLAQQLDGVLEEHRPLPPAARPEPWNPQTFRDERVLEGRPIGDSTRELPLIPKRDAPMAPLQRTRASAVRVINQELTTPLEAV